MSNSAGTQWPMPASDAERSEWLKIAEAAGIDGAWLLATREKSEQRSAHVGSVPAKLDDLEPAEWKIVHRHLTASMIGQGNSSPKWFINGRLWIARHQSWAAVPNRYGNRETMRTRDGRWSESGAWEALIAALVQDGRLSSQRMGEFRTIADEARELRERRERHRARLSEKSDR